MYVLQFLGSGLSVHLRFHGYCLWYVYPAVYRIGVVMSTPLVHTGARGW